MKVERFNHEKMIMEIIEVPESELCQNEFNTEQCPNVPYKDGSCVSCLRKYQWSYTVEQNRKAFWKRVYKNKKDN